MLFQKLTKGLAFASHVQYLYSSKKFEKYTF